MRRRFKQVDVFAAEPCKGNPLAVVLDGDAIRDSAMQAFAARTSLSETTFLLPPTSEDADDRGQRAGSAPGARGDPDAMFVPDPLFQLSRALR